MEAIPDEARSYADCLELAACGQVRDRVAVDSEHPGDGAGVEQLHCWDELASVLIDVHNGALLRNRYDCAILLVASSLESRMEAPMLDKNTEVHAPHSKKDKRVSVTMVESWATITLFYLETGLSGDDQPIEVRIEPPPSGQFEPWQLAPRLPLYVKYARAAMLWDDGAAVNALRALRDAGATRRGLSDDFYRRIADSYETIQAAGERYPVKTIAELNNVVISTASRWITEARRRGYLPVGERARKVPALYR
jgi:hypothetical protein